MNRSYFRFTTDGVFQAATTLVGVCPPFFWGLEITIRHATFGRPPLNKWSSRRKDVCPHNTQLPRKIEIHVTGGIRTHDPTKPAAAESRLSRRGHRDRHSGLNKIINIYDLQTSSEQKKTITIYVRTSKRISEYSETWMSFSCLQGCRH
jgi:hypothetical protein